MKRDEFVLYGLDGHKEVIDTIIADLDAGENYFDIRLMLTEALTNAFKHGNRSSADKPISLKYTYDGMNVLFEIADSGEGVQSIMIPDQVSEDDILNDCGRGLFLIQCMADKMELKDNTLIIEKYLPAQ